jgi:hypothetical protein
MHNRGYVVIQYWFFYAYNDWGTSHGGVNDHEGDWEAVFVFRQASQLSSPFLLTLAILSGMHGLTWHWRSGFATIS